jgi:hypothetical protein
MDPIDYSAYYESIVTQLTTLNQNMLNLITYVSGASSNLGLIALESNTISFSLTDANSSIGSMAQASVNTANSILTIANSTLTIANSTLTIANSLIGIDANTGVISIEANNNISKLTTINTTLYTDTENVVNMLVGVSGNLHSMNVHQETLKILANTTGLRITEPWGWLSMSSVANLAKKEGVDLTATYKDMKDITEF